MDITDWNPVFIDTYYPLKAGSIDATDTEPHDHGVVRALEAKYRPNKKVVGDPKKTLFIGRLNPNTKEHALDKAFSRYGEIKNLRLVRDIVTGFSKCYAFLEYTEASVADFVSKKANRLEIDGHEVLVDLECERILKGWIPRRLGGGLGGKKESGQLRFGGKDRPFRRPIIMKGKHSHERVDFSEDRQNYSESHRDYEPDGYSKDRHYDNRNRDSGRSTEKSIERSDTRRSNRSRERRRDHKRDQRKGFSRDRTRDRSRDQTRDRSRDRTREGSRDQTRDRSRDQTRDRSRDGTRDRSRDRTRDRSRDRKRDRRKHEYQDFKRERDRDKSIVREIEPVVILPENIDKLIKESLHTIWDGFDGSRNVSINIKSEENDS